MVSGILLSWAVEPKCRILIFMQSVWPLFEAAKLKFHGSDALTPVFEVCPQAPDQSDLDLNSRKHDGPKPLKRAEKAIVLHTYRVQVTSVSSLGVLLAGF